MLQEFAMGELAPYVPHPLVAPLGNLLELASAEGRVLDESVVRIGEYRYGVVGYGAHLLCNVTLASRLGMCRDSVRHHSGRIAELTVLFSCKERRDFELAVFGSRHLEIIHAVDGEMSDETPLPIRVRDFSQADDFNLPK